LPEGADLEALAAAYALIKLNPEARLLKPSSLSPRARKALERFKDLFNFLEGPAPDARIIVLGAGEPPPAVGGAAVFRRLGRLCTASLIGEVRRKNLPLTDKEATLLLAGVLAEAGPLWSAEPQALRAVAFLLERGANLTEARSLAKDRPSEVSVVRTPRGLKVAVVLSRERTEPADLLSEEVDAVVLLREKGPKVLLEVVPRERARELWGDSDPGEEFEGISAGRLRLYLTEFLAGRLRGLSVSAVAAGPPPRVRADEPVAAALDRLAGFGLPAAVVVDGEGRALGVVKTAELLRAVRYLGQKAAEVFDFTDDEVEFLKPSDPLWRVEAALGRSGKEFVPVVEGGRPTALLSERDAPLGLSEPTGPTVELPPEVGEVAARIASLARQLGFRVYLVGGVVRDLFLGKRVWDLDLVVEGDALRLARAVGESFGVRVHPFEEFGTAHLTVGRLKLELATARRERYARSGAYPEVEPAPLKEDLLRRDFTINAMALEPTPEGKGRLVDPLGGLSDLKEGVVRVLRPTSFVEDPVRILRALRFAGRFGFKLSPATERYLRRAVELGVLKNAPRGRLTAELRLALREENLPRIWELYARYGLDRGLFPEGVRLSNENLRKVARLFKLWKEVGADPSLCGWIALALLLSEAKEEEALQFLEELSAPSEVREVLFRLKEGRLSDLPREVERPSDLKRRLKGFSDWALLAAAAAAGPPLEKLILFYLKEVKPLKVKVDPGPLKKRGLKGRELGREIEKLKDAELDRALSGKWEALKREL